MIVLFCNYFFVILKISQKNPHELTQGQTMEAV